MHPARTLPCPISSPTSRCRTGRIRCVAAALTLPLLTACASLGLPPPPSGAGGLTVQGQYEVIAGCIAELSLNSANGPATLTTERSTKRATVRRVQQPSNQTQYELSFAQAGGTTVRVEGRAVADTAEARNGFAFLWSQVESCARDRMAP